MVIMTEQQQLVIPQCPNLSAHQKVQDGPCWDLVRDGLDQRCYNKPHIKEQIPLRGAQSYTDFEIPRNWQDATM